MHFSKNFFIILFISSSLKAAPRTCGHLNYDTTDTTYQCVPDGNRRGQPIYRCPVDDKYSCQRFGTEFWCCGEFCDPGLTFPLDLVTNEKCQVTGTGTAVMATCQSDPTGKECKLVESVNRYYCCPRNIPSASTMNPFNPLNPILQGLCEDFRSDCAAKANWCILEYAFERMFRDCPRTCNRCQNVRCQDMGIDCADRSRDGYCERAVYRDVMDWQCPFSCNRCEIRQQRIPKGRMPMPTMGIRIIG